jgi:hypothetical protein
MSQLSDQSTTRLSLVAIQCQNPMHFLMEIRFTIQGRGLSTFVVLVAGLKIVFGGRRKM